MKELKVLLVEDNDIHADTSGFSANTDVKRVKTLVEAVRELYGVSEYGYTNLNNPNPNNYNVLLTDLNFPMGKGKFGGNDVPELFYNSRESSDTPFPLGWPLIMIGTQIKIPLIGMLTDTNHHSGVMAASFDCLKKSTRKLEDSLVCVWDSRTWATNEKEETYRATNKNEAKQYHNLLRYLLNPTDKVREF